MGKVIPAGVRPPGVRPPGTSWPILLAVAITLTLLAEPLRGLFDGVTELLHFRDRAIGSTILEGLDASGYAENYIRLQALLAALVFGAYFLLARLRLWLDGALPPQLAAGEHRWIARVSEIWIALAVFELFVRDEFLATLRSLCGHAVFLVLMVLAARIWDRGRRPGGDRRQTILRPFLADPPLLLATLFLPLCLIFAFWVLAGRPMSFAGGTVSFWFLVVVALWAAVLALHRLALHRLAVRRRLGAGAEPSTRGPSRCEPDEIHALGTRLAAAAVPLLLIPASLPLANELQYRFPSFAPETLARLAVAGLGLASLALYGFFGRRPPRFSTAALLHNVYYPVFLATCAFFKTHQHRRFLGGLDYFHLGEETVPTQQWLEFGSVPMVDLRLAHTFSDMFYQGLYSLVHGYRGLDMLTWISWMPEVLAVLLLYFVVARVVSPGFSVLVVALMPILGAVSEYFAVAFLPALALHFALARPTWVRFAAMWASFLGLALWRVDFGMIGAVALALVLGVYLLRSPAHRWRSALLGLGWVAAAGVAGFFLFMLWSDRPALASMASLFQSYSYRLITRTRAEIIAEYSPLAVLQYYLLPAVSLVYIVYYGVAKLLRRGYLERYKVMLVFVAIFSLVLSVRSLERHSLIEKFNPYYFVFLLAFLPFLFRRPGSAREAHGPRLACLGVLILNAVLLMPVSLYGAGRHQMHHLMKPGPVFEFHRWEEGAERVFFHRDNHQALVDFLERELTGDQTFFDFTNSPLLYVLANKRFPTYVIPNLVQTAEPIQQEVVEDLAALHDAGLLPYVIFKQGHDFWDRTDGVPNEVRSYRIAEFIYRRYEPLARFGRYEVWCAEGGRPGEPPGSDVVVHELDLVSGEAGTIQANDLEAGVGEEGVVLAAGAGDPYAFGIFDLSAAPLLTAKGHWRLELDYSSTAAGDLQLFFSLDGGRFTALTSAFGRLHAGSGRLTVSIPHREEARRLSDIRLDPPIHATVTVRRGVLQGSDGKILPLAPEDVDQSFDLGRLPYVWGRHDPLAAASRTAVLAELHRDPVRLDGGAELVLALDPAVDKTLGNYLHLRLRQAWALDGPDAGDEEIDVTVSYGEGLANGFTFEVVAWPEGSHGAWILEKTGSPVMYHIESFNLGKRVIFEAAGEDPHVYRVFDLQGSPQDSQGALRRRDAGRRDPTADAAADGELYLRLRYRSSTAGGLQVFYSFDEQPFSEDRSRSVRIVKTTDHGEPAEVVVPVSVPAAGDPAEAPGRLTDIRFDIPDGSLFEVVSAEIQRRPAGYEDYLVRLSSQWKWVSEPVSRLVLTTSGPVEVGEVLLRGGD